MRERKCLNCGKLFVPKQRRGNQKFCSQECNHEFNHKKRRDDFSKGYVYVLENVEAEDDKEAWRLEIRA